MPSEFNVVKLGIVLWFSLVARLITTYLSLSFVSLKYCLVATLMIAIYEHNLS